MQKVLLIIPPETTQTGFFCPPLGLLYLAGTLKKQSIDVQFIDGCIKGWSGIQEKIKTYLPDIVGITCLTSMRKRALSVARMVKEINRDITVVLGGAHATIMYDQLLSHYDDIDIVVRGEGEMTFLEIAQGVELDKIDGIVFRDSEGKIKKNANRHYVEDLDKLPFPAWDLITDILWEYPSNGPAQYRYYNGIDLHNGPRIPVIFSRGCMGHCEFCSTWWIWKGWRHRSAENMVDELEWICDFFKIRHFVFADDAFTIDRQAILDFCDEILKRQLNIAFCANTRTDCVDLEILEKLKRVGCYEVSYGIETASPTLLSRMKKENDARNAEKAVTLTKQAGLNPGVLLIVGNVGETEDTIDETIDFLKKNNIDSTGTVGGLWIFPGTGLYRHAKKLGIINDSFWLGDDPYMVYTYEHSLRELRFFVHAIKECKKLSEMTTVYRVNYNLRTYIMDLKNTVSSALDKYPKIKLDLKRFYFAIKDSF